VENPIDSLFQEWHRLGGAVLLTAEDRDLALRPAEEVLAESTRYCRHSGRLTWVVLDWLIRHAGQIDAEALLDTTREVGDLSVLGVLADAAYQRNTHPLLRRLMDACSPHPRTELFFHRVAASPLASKLTREAPLELFRRWNYLCNEPRYL
jgi:hypothetical protein